MIQNPYTWGLYLCELSAGIWLELFLSLLYPSLLFSLSYTIFFLFMDLFFSILFFSCHLSFFSSLFLLPSHLPWVSLSLPDFFLSSSSLSSSFSLSCWLSLEGGLLYAFVGPAAAVVLVLPISLSQPLFVWETFVALLILDEHLATEICKIL